jgi:hypothetical protein
MCFTCIYAVVIVKDEKYELRTIKKRFYERAYIFLATLKLLKRFIDECSLGMKVMALNMTTTNGISRKQKIVNNRNSRCSEQSS